VTIEVHELQLENNVARSVIISRDVFLRLGLNNPTAAERSVSLSALPLLEACFVARVSVKSVHASSLPVRDSDNRNASTTMSTTLTIGAALA
jgi:hypothetical protein